MASSYWNVSVFVGSAPAGNHRSRYHLFGKQGVNHTGFFQPLVKSQVQIRRQEILLFDWFLNIHNIRYESFLPRHRWFTWVKWVGPAYAFPAFLLQRDPGKQSTFQDISQGLVCFQLASSFKTVRPYIGRFFLSHGVSLISLNAKLKLWWVQ